MNSSTSGREDCDSTGDTSQLAIPLTPALILLLHPDIQGFEAMTTTNVFLAGVMSDAKFAGYFKFAFSCQHEAKSARGGRNNPV